MSFYENREWIVKRLLLAARDHLEIDSSGSSNSELGRLADQYVREAMNELTAEDEEFDRDDRREVTLKILIAVVRALIDRDRGK